MRNPRIDPQKGDVLEHQNGERRAVVARQQEDSTVRYRDGSTVSDCSAAQWQEWAEQTSIVDIAG